MKEHKPTCSVNISCAVVHSDGICPGPYGKCDCGVDSPMKEQEETTFILLHKPVGGVNINGIEYVPEELVAQEKTKSYKAGLERAVEYVIKTNCMSSGESYDRKYLMNILEEAKSLPVKEDDK